MKTKLNIGHDRLTLKVTSLLQVKVTLTISRSGESISAPASFPRPTLEALVRGFRQALESKESYGDIMARLEKMAAAADTYKGFADAMEASPV